MSEFTPPGYMRVGDVVMSIIRHLRPDCTEQQLSELLGEEAHRVFDEALDLLHSLLFEGAIAGFYNQPVFNGLTEIPKAFWLSVDAGKALRDGEYWPFGPNRHHWDRLPTAPIFYKAEALRAVLAQRQRALSPPHSRARLSNAGAKAKFDWPAYEEAYMAEVRTRGFPSELNVKGWQSQADVVRYLQELAQQDGLDLPDSTAKPYARRFLERAALDDN
ncbi:hypothetical protein [Neorhizobium sp. DAR64860/K0K1]|uniref:hypothetical protein n=1 Tax=Neorhizobium sp. DAR64860/K0K1 TaxID=3421955 RepID=UPI003D2BBDC8